MNIELSNLITEYVKDSSELIDSLMSKTAYSVDENRLKDLSDRLVKSGVIEDSASFVKQASVGPDVFIDVLNRISTPKEEKRTLIKLGSAQRKDRIQKGGNTSESEADQMLLKRFGII